MLYIYGTAANEYQICGRISADGTNHTEVCSTTTNYATGALHHAAMVSDDTDIRIYVDGSLHCTPGAHTAGIYSSGDAEFQIGALIYNESADDFFNGLIDETSVWKRALSADEVKRLYNKGLSGNNGGDD